MDFLYLDAFHLRGIMIITLCQLIAINTQAV